MPKAGPCTRRVYLDIGEVIDPQTSPVDVTRCSDVTLFTIHPGTPAPTSIEAVAQRIHEGELWPWISPWADLSPLALAELKSDPLAVLRREAPYILCVPTTRPEVIPLQQRPAWRR